jgi:hypothetical protein
LIWKGELIKEGSTYMFADGSLVLGDSIEKAVGWFNDKKNQKEVQIFKRKLNNKKLIEID